MGLGVTSVQLKFIATRGNDPLFAPIDGANCPNTSSQDPSTHSLLLKSGLIRVFLPVPPNAQFQIQAYHDPYGCAIVTDPTSVETVSIYRRTSGVETVSIYRRPLPTTNLRYLSAVMFDGRETHQVLTSEATFAANLQTDLIQQAIDATLTHAQATEPPTTAQQTAIVNFELGLSSAQTLDFRAGWLNFAGALGGPAFAGALGGPANLSQQSYYPGTNDSLGADPQGNAFNSSLGEFTRSYAPQNCRRRNALQYTRAHHLERPRLDR